MIWLLALAVGATAQGIRLTVKDDLPFGPARGWLIANAPDKVGELVTCPWCMSGWLSLAATAAVWSVDGLPMPFLAWLTVWSLAKLLYFVTEAVAKYATA